MKVQCRKCNGNHFTIKCDSIVSSSDKPTIQQTPPLHTKPKVFKIKISDLPCDITRDELSANLVGWGPVTDIKVFNYKENSIAYIEFSSEIHGKHFAAALNKTPYGNMIIHVSLIF